MWGLQTPYIPTAVLGLGVLNDLKKKPSIAAAQRAVQLYIVDVLALPADYEVARLATGRARPLAALQRFFADTLSGRLAHW